MNMASLAGTTRRGEPGRSSQSGSLILLGGAVALLLVGLFGFDRARVSYASAERDLARAESALADARSQAQLAQQNRLLLEAANTLQQHAQSSTVLPPYWGERQINLRQQNMTREQANQVMLTTVRSNEQLLKAEEFELAVTHADEGLFDTPSITRQPVLLSLRGTTRFRISER